MEPDISIIIPAYNEAKYIRETLHSIKNQTYQNYEIIVVANGCTDATEEILKKRENDRVRHLSLPKANVSVARNAGALNAKGNLLLFLDADTKLAPDSLHTIKQQFTDQYAVATTKVLPDSDQLKYKLAMMLKNVYNSTRLYQGCSGALICRKDAFQKVNGYPPDLVVREHRKLIIELKKQGKYGCMDTYVTTSMRRFQQWGLGKTVAFWTRQWVKDRLSTLPGSKYETIR